MADASSVTVLLHNLSRGDRAALDELVPLVYDTLRRLAHRALRRERGARTLGTTELAHEAFLKLVGLQRMSWQDRQHFFAVAAQAMRRILVDHAVARKAQKRGAGRRRIDLDEAVLVSDDRLEDVLMLDEAMGRLESWAPRAARVVECRVFVGMTIDETAEALGLAPATVKRHWSAARAWLTRELSIRPARTGSSS